MRSSASLSAPSAFNAEIHLAAQLQHPHILPVHDSGESAGRLYYVMPYVQGESLGERLKREGTLPVAEVVRLLEEIVEALAYAHAQGVVHRDIKPDNIMLSGRHALLADLGVAKAVHSAERERDGLTSTGIALGTPRYMAPSRWLPIPNVDHREHPCSGGHGVRDAHRVSAVSRRFAAGGPRRADHTSAHPLDTIRPGISPVLSQAIAKCLAPWPDQRWQSAADLLTQLERVHDSGGVTVPGQPAPPAPSPRRRPALIWGIGGSLAALALATFVLARRPETEIRFGARNPLTVDPGLEIDPAVSPDGQFVAYAAGPLTESKIVVRQVDGGRPIAIADLPGAQRLPYWSPDGKRILFRSARGIEVAPALGGPPKTAISREGGVVLLPGPWSPDGHSIAFDRSDSLYAMPSEGGVPTLLAQGGDMHSFAWSPDDRWIALVRGNRQSVDSDVRWFFGNHGSSAIWLVPSRPGGGDAVRLTDDRSFHASPLWLPDARELLFLSNADGGLDVYHIAVDRSGTTKGQPERLTTGLNAHAMSIDAGGRQLSYEVLEERSNVWAMPIPDRPPVSIAEAVPVTTGNQVIEEFDISPDGRWVTFDSDRSGVAQIYRAPIGGGQSEQLTTGSSASFWPRWSPDGREIVYHSYRTYRGGRRRLFLMPADGGASTQLPTGDGDEVSPEWKRDGRGVYYLDNFDSPRTEIRLLPRDAAGRWGMPTTILRIDALPGVASPDLQRLAYATDKGLMLVTPGRDSARVLVPGSFRSRALRPAYESWSSDGRTLYYLALDSLDRASIWSVDPRTANRKLLVRFDEPGREWHRYGFGAYRGRFYFTLGDRQSDLWMTSVEQKR